LQYWLALPAVRPGWLLPQPLATTIVIAATAAVCARIAKSPNHRTVAAAHTAASALKLTIVDGVRAPVKRRYRRAHPRAAVIVVLAVVAWATLAPTAGASFPGRNGQIAFSDEGPNLCCSPELGAENNPTAAIDLIAPTGGRVTTLCATSDCGEAEPAFSPDGRLIAFVGRGEAIMVMNADGTQRRIVAPIGEHPAFSPDGRQLVFSEPVVGAEGIAIVNLDGSAMHRITAGRADRQPTWSTRGLIAFSRHGEIFTMTPAGRNLRKVSSDGRTPDFSPHGNRLVYTTARHHAVIMSADGTNKRHLSRRSCNAPAWAPDGTEIVCDDFQDLFLIRPDGRERHRIRHPRTDHHSYAQPTWQPRGLLA
jgi:hypothetical protein